MTATGAERTAHFGVNARRLLALAWPVALGQFAVIAFSTIDTVLVARYAAVDLAALAIGASIYITVFVGLMGVVLAVGPIAGQLFGARQLHDAGDALHQSVWLALGLSALGSTLLLFPGPFLALAQASPAVATDVRGYLSALAFALPASLLFTAYRGFNVAVSRPKAVMALQIGALLFKLPLTAALVYGVPALGLPELGVTGCGVATALVMWTQCALAWFVLTRDPFYVQFNLRGRGLHPASARALMSLLKLGVPMGLGILIEIMGFTFMALFIARLGTHAVAGHQIAVNLTAMMFMVPLAIGNASCTLVAQRIGAADMADARRLAWHGLVLGVGIAVLLSGVIALARAPIVALYSPDPTVIAAALPLLTWLVVFHSADALQTITAHVLRAYRIAAVPMVIYVFAILGLGLGGGYVLAFDVLGNTPTTLLGAPGFWAAASAGLLLAGLALTAFLAYVQRQTA